MAKEDVEDCASWKETSPGIYPQDKGDHSVSADTG